MKRIIYGKLGRAVILEPRRWGPVGGDHEALYFLEELARRHPDVEFVVGSRYVPPDDGEAMLPPNVVLPPLPTKVKTRNKYNKLEDGTKERIYDESIRPWEESEEILRPYFDSADGVLLWLGQHGGANYPVPSVEKGRDVPCKPLDEQMLYSAPLTLSINRWREADPVRREEVWLMSDVRNYLKARELKWPLRQPVLSQYDFTKNLRQERWEDPRSPGDCGYSGDVSDLGDGTWRSVVHYCHAGLEIVRPGYEVGLSWEERVPFAIMANEARAGRKLPRAPIFREWVSGITTVVYGKWTEDGAAAAGITSAEPVHQSRIPAYVGGAHSTFTMPTSGSGWPTPKPHEAFKLGTVCFFHPAYDDQGHVIPTLEQLRRGAWSEDEGLRNLALWLRVPTPDDLAERVRIVGEDRQTYELLRDAQLRLEQRYLDEDLAFTSIERRLGLR